MSTTKRITKRLIAVVLTVLMLMSMVTIGMTSASAAYVDLAQTGVTLTGGEVLYLKPGVWVVDNARFAACFCNGTSDATWANMTDPDGDGQYEVTVPANSNHKNVIFCRMNPSVTANNWNNKWNQSNDLTYDGSKNLYTITGWGPDGGKSPGSWSVYVPPAPAKPGDASGWNVIGDFNGDTFTKLNSLVYAEDTSIATHTMELDQGTYKFKVVDDAKSLWLDYTKLAPELTNGGGTLSTDGTKVNNVKLVADGGTYTFNYTVKTQKLDIVYTAPVVEPPVPPATPEATITAIGANGTGTADDPYVATAGTEVQFNIAAKGEATGFEYIINGGEVTTEATFKATAPAAGTEVTYTVDVYAYNQNTEGKASSDPCKLTFVLKGEEEVVIDPNGTPFAIDWAEEDGLYVYAGDADKITEENKPDTEAWQLWLEKSTGNCVVYLPASANAGKVAIFNAYDHTICVGTTPIDAGCYEIVEYVEGTTYNTTKAEDQTLTIYRTDAEASLFINTDKENGSVVNESKVETGLKDLTGKIWYDYITEASKNREAKKLGGAVAFDDGVVVEAVKKIKGRGNSTWSETKKPFNITFNSKIAIDGMDKFGKWSLLANAKDDSLMRNRLVYDMANEVNMKYACDSRFVDFFVDGKYMGSYQLVQKIEMELGSVMSDLEEPIVKAKNEGDVVPVENFDFVLELDTQNNANGAGDKTFKTGRKQVMTHKIPDEPTAEQVEFMKAKYQALEDAIYGDDLATLESIIDINDFVRAYLVNEIAKNIDTGVTSCYFVYDSDAGKFFASPVWDYDNALGNMENGRTNMAGETLSIIDTDGWYTREMSHDQDGFTGGRGIFSQAYYMTSKTADGKTFADIAAEIWATDFADIDDILAGDIKAEHGRLKSIEEYKALLAKSGKWNYEKTWKADNGWTLTQNWTADHSKLTMYDYDAESNTYTVTGKTYKENVPADMNQFVGDWLISRINWIDVQYNDAKELTKTVYVGVIEYIKNAVPTLHYWNDAGLSGDATLTRFGEVTESFAVGSSYWSNAPQKFNIYTAEIPAGATGMKTWMSEKVWSDIDLTYAEDQIVLVFEYDKAYHNITAEYTYVPPVVYKPIYLDVTNWVVAGETASYAVEYFLPGNAGIATVAEDDENVKEMTLVDGNIYTAEIPEDSESVKFTKTVTADGVTIVTTDVLTVDPESDLFTIEGVDENNLATGTWSVYTEVPDDPDDPDDPDIPVVENVVVYVVNSKNWEKVNAYIWSVEGDTEEPADAWPGVALQATGDKSEYGSDVYAMSFESKYTSVIFNNGTLQTKDLTVKDGQYYDLSNGQWYETLVEVPEPLPEPEPVKLYLTPGAWEVDGAWYAAYVWGDGVAATWHKMTDVDSDGTYEVEIPAENANVIFTRLNPAYTEAGWNNETVQNKVWNQTANLTIPTDGTNCYTITGAWSNPVKGTWDTYVVPEIPVEMTTIYFNDKGIWNLDETSNVTVSYILKGEFVTAPMTAVPGGFTAEVPADATSLTFGTTVTDEDDIPAEYSITANVEEGKNLAYLEYITDDAGEPTEEIKVVWDTYVEPVKPVDRTIYLAINGIWEGSVPAVVYNGETIALTAVEGEEEIYTATIKYVEGIEDIVFIYSVEFDDNVPTVLEPEKDLFTLLEVEESEGAVTVSGTWSVYGEEIPDDPDDPDMPTVVTVKVINSANWDEVYAYVWADEVAVKWPGTEMDLTEETVNGFDIYALSFNSDYTNIIFNNNDNGQQTANLIVTDGYYYDVATKEWYATLEDVPDPDPLATGNYLVGSWDNWDAIANQFMLNEEGDRVGYVTLDLEVGEYEFKVIRHGTWASCKDVPAITETTNNITVSTGVTGNCVLTVEEAGTYTFAFASKDSLLAVTYPGDELAIPDEKVVDNNYYIHSDFAGEWGDLVLEGEGTVLTATAELEYGTYQFKITQNGKWYGNNGTIEDTCEGWHFKEKDAEGNDTKDCTLKATGGTYTFTFDTETMMLTVTAELTPPEFEVTYNSGNFTFEGDETATLDEAYTFTVTPEDGFVIAAVIYDMEELEAVDGVYTIENVQGDINLYIVTALESSTPPNSKFTVIFLKDDGSIYATRKEIQPGTLHPLPPALYKEGYIFKGWSPEVEIVKNDAGQDCIEVTKDYVFSPVFEEDTNDLPLIPVPTDPPVEPEVKTYTVIFIDNDNKFLGYQVVEEGQAATAPEIKDRPGYTFEGWDKDFTNVTENMTVMGTFKKNAVTPPAPATEGTLKIDVTGGTSFTLNGRPQGTSYYNTKMKIGESVTVTAATTNTNKFLGWVNVASSRIETTDVTFTFTTSGNDYYRALYSSDVEGVNMVMFYNDKSGQYWDLQYYAYGESIVYPDAIPQAGWDFAGWSMTDAEIQAQLKAGNDVTVLAKWTVAKVYIDVTVTGGIVTGGTPNADGQYIANSAVTVTANAPETGMKFAYWAEVDANGEVTKIKSYDTTYKFFPAASISLKAIFVSESDSVDYDVLVSVDNCDTSGQYGVFNFSWFVPTTQNNLTYKSAGIVFVNKANLNESTLIHGTTDSNVYDRTVPGSYSKPVNSYNWTAPMMSDQTWCAKAWVQYVDNATGKIITEYSELFEAYKE